MQNIPVGRFIDSEFALPRGPGSKFLDLALAMRENGQETPIEVQQIGEQFKVVHGWRRFRAAQLMNWATINAIVIEKKEEEEEEEEEKEKEKEEEGDRWDGLE